MAAGHRHQRAAQHRAGRPPPPGGPRPRPAPRHRAGFRGRAGGPDGGCRRLAAAQRALRRLRRGEREVFTLYVWAGLDYAAVAEALGVPIGTVRSRLSRARRRLRELASEELACERAEPTSRSGQQQDGRTIAARSIQEQTR